jgi:RNA polymerase sigma-70 factor (ECF subfamily)
MTEPNQIKSSVTAAQGGDRLALTKLLTTYDRRLRARAEARMPAAVKAKSSPDDILQEVYLDVFRQIDRFEDRGPGSFLNWLYAILDGKLGGALRAAHRRARDIGREAPVAGGTGSSSHWDLLDQLYADSATPSRVVRRQEALGALSACISGLSESHRQVIHLRFLEGLSVSEVARRLGKSEAAVVALSQRALNVLRRSMDQMGEFTRGT